MIGFVYPWLLSALAALPALWWLLRLTPPRAQAEIFPPFKILAKLTNFAETAQRSPWWLLLLRLLIVTFTIIGLSQPTLRPKPIMLATDAPLLLIVDNSWANAEHWQQRLDLAGEFLDEATRLNKTVYLLPTADPINDGTLLPLTPKQAEKKMRALTVRALEADRSALSKLVDAVQKEHRNVDIVYLTDGLATQQDQAALSEFTKLAIDHFYWYQSDSSNLLAIRSVNALPEGLRVDLVQSGPKQHTALNIKAYDLKGRILGQSGAEFAEGSPSTQSLLKIPSQLRNDVAWLKIDNRHDAATIFLLDRQSKPKKVAVLTPETGQMAQPLLAPLYYVTKALQGKNEVILAKNGPLTAVLDQLFEQRPSVLIMGDVANIPEDVQSKIDDFIEKGGIFIRFAGANLAAASKLDQLLPVQLRLGVRGLSGTMSWVKPQEIGAFTDKGPFAGMKIPKSVLISRQILAEPTANLSEKTWVSLQDGTPLITGEQRGQGRLIFIHTSPEITWSNLALDGFFVNMLNKLVDLAGQPLAGYSRINDSFVKPWRLLSANGDLDASINAAQPLKIGEGQVKPTASPQHPAGFYGDEKNFIAINLFNQKSTLSPLTALPELALRKDYSDPQTVPLAGWLLFIALVLFMVDALLLINPRQLIRKRFYLIFLWGMSFLYVLSFSDDFKAKAAPDSVNTVITQQMIDDASKTHLAYVITHNQEIDETSLSGLRALSQFVESRTTINPGEVRGVNLDQDELAFYPLIYWPVDPSQPLPDEKAIENINNYMQHGGTVIFDTRDELTSHLHIDEQASPATLRLREILRDLNIPALAAVNSDHVLSHSFYIMPEFPGRYHGSPLWAEALDQTDSDNSAIHGGDGVSPILITANDLAGAWASEGGSWKYALIPDDNMQRIWAFRGGLNIVMYVLSGNYKADQIHVPELLKRLSKDRSN